MEKPDNFSSYAPFVEDGNLCIPLMMDHKWAVYTWATWSLEESDALIADLQSAGIQNLYFLSNVLDVFGTLVLDQSAVSRLLKIDSDFTPDEYYLFSEDLQVLLFCSNPGDVLAIGLSGVELVNLLNVLNKEHSSTVKGISKS